MNVKDCIKNLSPLGSHIVDKSSEKWLHSKQDVVNKSLGIQFRLEVWGFWEAFDLKLLLIFLYETCNTVKCLFWYLLIISTPLVLLSNRKMLWVTRQTLQTTKAPLKFAFQGNIKKARARAFCFNKQLWNFLEANKVFKCKGASGKTKQGIF